MSNPIFRVFLALAANLSMRALDAASGAGYLSNVIVESAVNLR